MNSLTSLSDKIKEVERIREEIHTAIMNLPDNPDIKRSGNCFIMSSSQIFANAKNPSKRMDVFFHDFNKQYEKIAELIDSCHSENIITILNNVVKSGSYNGGGHYYRFHPDVISNLSSILGIA